MAADNEKNMKKIEKVDSSFFFSLSFFSHDNSFIVVLCVLESDGCSDWVENRIPHVGPPFKK